MQVTASRIIRLAQNAQNVQNSLSSCTISGTTVTEEQAERYHIPQGVYVYSVSENSVSGLQQGDVITAINGTEITTMEELNEQKNLYKAGETVSLRISRGGESINVQVTLQESRPEE